MATNQDKKKQQQPKDSYRDPQRNQSKKRPSGQEPSR